VKDFANELTNGATSSERSIFRTRAGMSRILFCEDDPSVHKLIRTALRNSPHEVLMANNGAEGLELAKAMKPVIVFSDVAMPIMDGFQLADAMRADPELATIPIVFITASIQRSDREEALRHGALRVIGKPFTIAQLRELVAEVL
jgi:CheY-like chemotaxis protein